MLKKMGNIENKYKLDLPKRDQYKPHLKPMVLLVSRITDIPLRYVTAHCILLFILLSQSSLSLVPEPFFPYCVCMYIFDNHSIFHTSLFFNMITLCPLKFSQSLSYLFQVSPMTQTYLSPNKIAITSEGSWSNDTSPFSSHVQNIRSCTGIQVFFVSFKPFYPQLLSSKTPDFLNSLHQTISLICISYGSGCTSH